ncbi:unnamed protein product [Rhizoctonia solani]|uniref:Thioester reductase (TE) domain-containing protein n=1 Tax=Rhizoctonia solani TaxID=456999 RepID=A0A8H2ZYF3_9AGAM|nr:unnamed protein product [Rhizoctonia solani]
MTSLETEIARCPIVRHAVLFGGEDKKSGALIELKASANGLYQTQEGRQKAMEEIWPYIERANQALPTSSPVESRAVILVDPEYPLPLTIEGTVARSAALKLYAPDIEEKYLALRKCLSACTRVDMGIKPPDSSADSNKFKAWVDKVVTSPLSGELNDSPTATILLPSPKNNLHPITAANRRLTQLLIHLSQNNGVPVDQVTEVLHNMHAIIEKYDTPWPCWEICNIQPLKERVVVTGTTGALGSHLLAYLLNSDKVDKVWAINRRSHKGDVKERQFTSFKDKLLDLNLLGSGKLRFLDTNCEDSKLGLCDEMYNEIRAEATLIIHNAWKVNFNHDLQSFEPNIRSARNLLDLAFHSNAPTGLPRFAFPSSITVAGFACHGKRLNEVPVALEDAVTSGGYGQSCLPGAIGHVSWLPLDVAAHSVIDTCFAREVKIPSIVHTSHPRPVPWIEMIKAFSASIGSRIGFELPIVRFDAWHKRVVEAAASFEGSKIDRYKRFPSIKIRRTIDGVARSDEKLREHGGPSSAEFGGLVSLDTAVAQALSKSLESTQELGIEHVEKWVTYWESVGFLELI